MNTRIILFAGVLAAFSSCTTAYRTGQTPDDVYYSPGRETEAYVQMERQPEAGSRYESYESYENPDDRYLRMMVRNRSRWSAFDNYSMMDWRYNPYNTYNTFSPHYSYGFAPMNPWGYSSFNNYWHWNTFYNPYYSNVIVLNPKTNPANYSKIRNFNLGSYTNTNYYRTNRPAKTALRPRLNSQYYSTPASRDPKSNPRLGTSVKKVFSNENSRPASRDRYYSPGSATERPNRTYEPSSSSRQSSTSPAPVRSSGGGGTGSSSGGGVSRPSRGN